MSANDPLLLVVDYNLTRVADVARIARHARSRYNAGTILIRAQPGARDREIADYVVDLDPLAHGFIAIALDRLAPFVGRIRAGVVFSDNAVQRGAELLEQLGLPVDSARFAAAAFSKSVYRESESRIRELLEAQSIMVPQSTSVRELKDLHRFAEKHPGGFVLKPACEGNNRGVVIVRDGDDLSHAFALVEPYLAHGAIAEELIPFRREFSFDGVGSTEFITEKVSAEGRYPVEIAQILPARLTDIERCTLTRTGRLANFIVGQRDGPFHNEIRLSDDGWRAAVVEPNRRPAGMKIWTLAQAVYGIDFYRNWVDVAFGNGRNEPVNATSREAATVMLGVPADGRYVPPPEDAAQALLHRAVRRAEAVCGISTGLIDVLEYAWLSPDKREIPEVPRENSDFAAQVCFAIDDGVADLRHLIRVLRNEWLAALKEAIDLGHVEYEQRIVEHA
ncbi:ATP-grasp domain-containing protein [Burkholderia multivorans]|uniref:ATP-grasp domain-containing protein n=1 Tax=Burkholderia multivorans TaxID=87883 RepID=UPI000F4F4B0F|nr:biotin carboxylase [Burkholderia multivorans]AYY57733.1 biotin carboxylase [Burkholderia multivorans]MCA8436628.1 biotin carboxylase [Burkholderia multivorans]MDN7969127.1 biotin carboxylase [Burkholderia multivorans]